MRTTYEFTTAKGTKATVIADKINDLYLNGEKKETGVNGIVGVVVNGQEYKAQWGEVQGMTGAAFSIGGKKAFVPVPQNIMDEIYEESRAREERAKEIAKIDAELAAFDRYMDNENN